MFYIDESGIITNINPHPQNSRDHYFVICLIQTEDAKRLKTVYKRTLRKLKSCFPHFFQLLNNPHEPKGSELTPVMKAFFIEQFLTLTDIQISHIVVDNRKVMDVFRKNSTQSFNYLIKLMLLHMKLSPSDKQNLILNIDNRNVAIKHNKQLEQYLRTELMLQGYVQQLHVYYLNSEQAYGIRVADVFANIIYQRFRYVTINFPDYTHEAKIKKMHTHPYSAHYLYELIARSGRLRTTFMFPPTEIKQLKTKIPTL